MMRYLKFALLFLALAHYKVDAVSKVFSTGGRIISNGFSVSQEGDKLNCGSLICSGAVNCEIIKNGSDVNEKCLDSNLNLIKEKSSKSSETSDAEIYYGPAYQKQAAEQVRQAIYKALQGAYTGYPLGNTNSTYQSIKI